jgi:hypothetical protein
LNSLKLGLQNFNYNNTTILTFDGPYIYASFFDNNTIDKGTIDTSILNSSTINGASLINTYFNDGVFNSGYFMDSNDLSEVGMCFCHLTRLVLVEKNLFNNIKSFIESEVSI